MKIVRLSYLNSHAQIYSLMKVLLNIALFFAFTSTVFSQSTDKVSQLVATENYFAALVKSKGLKKAFIKVSDDNSIIYRPEPVNAKKYYKDQPDSVGYLTWEPVFARIAKSEDWGFTTGPFVFKKTEDSPPAYYGSYVSIWKKNRKGIWKLAVDVGVSHKKPTKKPELNFANPTNEIFIHQRSKNRLQQREDIVFSSDKLLSTIQKADNKIAQNEFLATESILLFPDYEPIKGKKAIMDFWKKREFRETSVPQKADRAYSGEYAFTQGDATIIGKLGPKKFHYVRIWEVQPGYKWNIILQVYTEAGE